MAEHDAVDDVAPLVRAVAGHALPVVLATWALAYLDDARQRFERRTIHAVASQKRLASLKFCAEPLHGLSTRTFGTD